MSLKITDPEETNSRVYRQKRREHVCKADGRCTICRPHSGENKLYKKHGIKKPKYKNKRITGGYIHE